MCFILRTQHSNYVSSCWWDLGQFSLTIPKTGVDPGGGLKYCSKCLYIPLPSKKSTNNAKNVAFDATARLRQELCRSRKCANSHELNAAVSWQPASRLNVRRRGTWVMTQRRYCGHRPRLMKLFGGEQDTQRGRDDRFSSEERLQNCANNAPGRIHLGWRWLTIIRDVTAAAAGGRRRTPSAFSRLLKSTGKLICTWCMLPTFHIADCGKQSPAA